MATVVYMGDEAETDAFGHRFVFGVAVWLDDREHMAALWKLRHNPQFFITHTRPELVQKLTNSVLSPEVGLDR